MNPDCKAGKHHPCSGTAWEDDTDQLVECVCSCHGRTLPSMTEPTEPQDLDEHHAATYPPYADHPGPLSECYWCAYGNRTQR